MSWNSMCPSCGSRKRHRALAVLLPQLMGAPERVLHFAPEPTLAQIIIESLPESSYSTTDRFMDHVDYPGEDIQNLSFSDNFTDAVLCNHVIEHVPNDGEALDEIARILRPGGAAYITVPGNWARATVFFDDPPAHNGHYRDYGNDFIEQLHHHFSSVEVVDFDSIDVGPHGLSYGIDGDDLLFICRK